MPLDEVTRSVRTWMSQPVEAIAPHATVEEALEVMRDTSVRHLVVVQDGEVTGVVTERDLRRPHHDRDALEDQYRMGTERDVQSVMSTRVATVGASATIGVAAQRMIDRGVGCLPVLEATGALIGMLTRGDLLRALTVIDGDLDRPPG